MHTKAEGLSMTVIIVAVLGLLVLAVLFFMFSGKVVDFNKGLSTCNGYCSSTGACDPGFTAVPIKDCSDGMNPVAKGDGTCCYKIG